MVPDSWVTSSFPSSPFPLEFTPNHRQNNTHCLVSVTLPSSDHLRPRHSTSHLNHRALHFLGSPELSLPLPVSHYALCLALLTASRARLTGTPALLQENLQHGWECTKIPPLSTPWQWSRQAGSVSMRSWGFTYSLRGPEQGQAPLSPTEEQVPSVPAW